MFDEESVQQAPEQEQQSTDQQVASQEQAVVGAQQEETPQQMRFRDMRTAKERAERERDELMRALQQMQASQKSPEDTATDDIALGNDDIAEGKHLKKVTEKVKRLEQELKKHQQQSTVVTAEARIKSQYPDFDKVVSKDNIEALKEQHPEIAQTLNASTDIYSTAVSAYKLIKQFGIYQEDIYGADRERAQKNAAKPRPLSSVSPQQGDSPLSHANAFANGLTPELQKQLHKEMIEAMKNR